MKIKNIIHFSFLNFRIFYKTTIKIILSLTVVIACMTLAYGYRDGLRRVQEEMSGKALSEAYFSTYEKLDEKYDDMFSCYRSGCTPLTTDPIEAYSLRVEGEDAHCGINNQDYYFKLRYSKYVEKELYDAKISCDVVDPEGSIFALTEISDFEERFPGEELFLYKSEEYSHESVMISDYMLKSFGLSDEEISNICGKRISLFFNPTEEYTGFYLFRDVKISAVINSNIYYTNASNYRAQIVLGDIKLLDCENPEMYLDGYEWVYYSKSYIDMIKNAALLEKDGIEVINFHAGDATLYAELEEQNMVTDSVILVVVWMITGIIVIGLSINMFFKCRYFQKNHAMMYSLGCTKLGMFCIFEFELLWELLIAIVLSAGIVFAGCGLFGNYLYALLKMKVSVASMFGNGYFMVVIALVAVVLILYGILSIATFSGKRALEKLNME